MRFPNLFQNIAALSGLVATLLTVPSLNATTIFQGGGANHVAFEAEGSGTVIPGTPETWTNVADSAASGGAALVADGTNSTGDSPHSFAQYRIRFSASGSYYIYYRWKADAARTAGDAFTANSSWFGLTFGAYSTVADQSTYYRTTSNDTTAPANNAYAWRREPDTQTYAVAAGDLAAPVIFTMGTREAGMSFDRFVFSINPNLTPAELDALANSGTDIVNQGATETHVAFEAEGDKALIIPGTPETWTNVADAAASGGAALVADGTNSTGDSPHSFAQYRIRFSASGSYYIYYRWKADAARTAGDAFTANSSWFGLTFGAYSTVADQSTYYRTTSNDTTAPANNTYAWRREPDTQTYAVAVGDLAAPVTFTMGTREAGMSFDRFVFSTNPNLTPAELDALANSGARPVAPELSSAVGSAALNTVVVGFTRPLSPASVVAENFKISGSVAVNSATLSTADARMVILSTSAQTEGVRYTITVNNVRETSGTPVAPNSTVRFTAWTRVVGWATKEIYYGLAGNQMQTFLDDPRLAARQPDRVEYVRGFGLDRAPQTDNYGARLSAFFIPGQNAAYEFFVANDDEADLSLSSDPTEANLLSFGNLVLTPREFAEAPVGTSPDLLSGQRYALVGLLKQGGGDVYLRVATRRAGDATAPGDLPLLGGARISTWVNPDLGRIDITAQPANTSAPSGGHATFSVTFEGSDQPAYYQWLADGAEIPGANRRVLTTVALTAADNGRHYRVRISVAGADKLSDEATLTVTAGEPSTQRPFVGINFAGGGFGLPGELVSQDVAGVVPQENWNNLAGFTFESVALNDAAGSAVPVTLTAVGLTETWYSGTLATGSGNGVLFQGMVTAGTPTESVILTLNNVPAGRYGLIAYSVGFDFLAAYEQDYTLTGATTPPTITGRSETGLPYIANPAFRRSISTNPAQRDTGNYVRFDNVSPAADGSLNLSVFWAGSGGSGHQPAINALQLFRIVDAPPAPPVLVAPTLGAGGLVFGWTGGLAPFRVQFKSVLTEPWADIATVSVRTYTAPATAPQGFYRVAGSGGN